MSKIDLKSADLPTLAMAIAEGNTKRRHNASYLFQRRLEDQHDPEGARLAAQILTPHLGSTDKEEVESAILKVFSRGYSIGDEAEAFLLDQILKKENVYQHSYFWNKRSKATGGGIDANPVYKIACSERISELPDFLNRLFTSKKDWSQFTRDLWNNWLYEQAPDRVQSAFSQMCGHIAATPPPSLQDEWHADSRDTHIENLCQFFTKTLPHYPARDLSGLSVFSFDDAVFILDNPYLDDATREILKSEFERVQMHENTQTVHTSKSRSQRL